MVFVQDMVGQVVGAARGARLSQAYASESIVPADQARWRGAMPVREECFRVAREGRPLAVLTRHTNLATMRTSSRLELTYRAIADSLARMTTVGAFPTRGAPTGERRGAPRVGDGVIRLDAEGMVDYASPNAISAYHRLGSSADLVGRSLAEVTTGLLSGRNPIDEGLALVVTGRAPWRTEVESSSSTITLRSIPLTEAGVRTAEHGLSEAGGALEVEAVRTPQETLTVTVGDTGVGMPDGLDADRAGLGTRIVTSLIEDLRGRISWSSRPGGGTQVSFETLLRPVHPVQAPDEQQ